MEIIGQNHGHVMGELREVHRVRIQYAITGGWTDSDRQLNKRYEGKDVLKMAIDAYDGLAAENKALAEKLKDKNADLQK